MVNHRLDYGNDETIQEGTEGSSNERPPVLPLNESGIPAELKELPQWVYWSYAARDTKNGNAHWTKPPFSPATGHYADPTKPSTWGTYAESVAACGEHSGDGIGFVFTPDDPYVGIDLDDCRDSFTGAISPSALQLIHAISSYTEISPSGTGVKIIARGELPSGGAKRGQLEMYDQARYFTLTGHVLDGFPATIEERQDAVAALYTQRLGKPEPRELKPHAGVGVERMADGDIDGRGLWERAERQLQPYQRSLAGGQNAQKDGGEYHSESEADMALLTALAGTGLDEDEIGAAFFATPRGDMAINRYGDDDAHRRIERSAPKALDWANSAQDELPANVHPIRPEPLTETQMAEAIPARPRPRFTLLTGSSILSQSRPSFLIGGILVENTLSAMIGKEATFKSFISLDMALSVAAGIPFQDYAVAGGHVVYVAGEGSGGIAKRIAAWTRQHGCSLPETFHVLPEAVRLIEGGQVGEFITCVTTLPEKPRLIVVDTLARAIGGGDENSAKDMGMLISACDSLRRAFGAHVMLIHHENKKGDVRGSTSLPGAIDTRIDVHRSGEAVVLACAKQKDYDHFADITLVRRIVELANGESSLVFAKTEGRIPRPSSKTELLLAVLADSFDENGATATEWQKKCGEQGVGSSVFYTMYRELLNQGRITSSRRAGSRGARYTLAANDEEMNRACRQTALEIER